MDSGFIQPLGSIFNIVFGKVWLHDCVPRDVLCAGNSHVVLCGLTGTEEHSLSFAGIHLQLIRVWSVLKGDKGSVSATY